MVINHSVDCPDLIPLHSVSSDVASLNKKNARINGLSFISPKASTDRFGTLMREISQANDGAFISM